MCVCSGKWMDAQKTFNFFIKLDQWLGGAVGVWGGWSSRQSFVVMHLCNVYLAFSLIVGFYVMVYILQQCNMVTQDSLQTKIVHEHRLKLSHHQHHHSFHNLCRSGCSGMKKRRPQRSRANVGHKHPTSGFADMALVHVKMEVPIIPRTL